MTTDPVSPQARAANPRLSAFVTANAGSGKTKTLIDRVARLLLAGASPDEILCVTYTKAAAAEMQNRLFELLGDWSVREDPELRVQLADLEGRASSDYKAKELSAARALFARALETPGGLRIQTLHAFCEKLLRRFPLEAGISPGFEVLDDLAAAQLAKSARLGLARQVLKGDGRIAEAYARLSVDMAFDAFESLFDDFTARAGELREAIDSAEAAGGLEAVVWTTLTGTPEPLDPEAARAELEDMSAGPSPETWLAIAEGLDVKGAGVNAGKLRDVLRRTQGRPALADLRSILVTAQFKPQRGIGGDKTLRHAPELKAELDAEIERLHTLFIREKQAAAGRRTLDTLLLAEAWLTAYAIEKAHSGKLDFGDLIDRTLALTRDSQMAAWVLFKLDQGLAHVLVDEAQDTSPAQWSILRQLTEDFFAGAGQAGKEGALRRSLFVVGDQKQSIYSFQGASPERLELEFGHHSRRALAAGAAFERIELAVSWRSTRQVLGFVDAVYADPELSQGLMTGRDGMDAPLRHEARREDDGCIDLWDLVEPPEKSDRKAWEAPPDTPDPNSATRELARRIAREIAGIVNRGEAVGDKKSGGKRPARWGDFLVLVRRRGRLFDEVILELKRQGVPVGGADRLKLAEHILFDDLRALVRFALYPGDDLTLAALLRSPFCDVSDESLFALAYQRPETRLWEALMARSEAGTPDAGRAEWAQARQVLASVLSAAGQSPYDFIVGRLESAGSCGRTQRQRLLTRLGREAEEALGVFLEKTLELEQSGVRDLEAFAAALDSLKVDVKRETEAEAADEVRVMTAHGAKGLEASIIILPDTTFNDSDGAGLVRAADGTFLWLGAKNDDCPAQTDARALRKAAADQELQRLLYVGLTRARDRLIVCGALPGGRSADKPPGWWGVMEAVFANRLAGRFRRIEAEDFGFRRFGEDPEVLGQAGATPEAAKAPPPAWLSRPALPEPLARLASPSDLGDSARVAAVSPLAGAPGMGRFRRGELVHRLLQVLPDLPEATRHSAARRLLGKEAGLAVDQIEEMATAALGVLEHPDFAFLFGPGSRAEAAIVGGSGLLPPGLRISGRIDRLVVRADEILFADFKTNRPAPASIEAADPAYLRQLAMYWAVLSDLYPDRPVRAALVWTDGPLLTPAPEALLRKTLDQLYREA